MQGETRGIPYMKGGFIIDKIKDSMGGENVNVTKGGNYCLYHLHSDFSNKKGLVDSVSKYNSYVEKAAECGMTAMAFSEHGNTYGWYQKKMRHRKGGHEVHSWYRNVYYSRFRRKDS